MSTFDFPAITPNDMSIEFLSNTAIWQSPTSGAIQTRDRGGERFVARLQYRNLIDDARAEMVAFVARLNGRQHRVNLPYHALNNRGAFGGSPQVAGAGQTGTTLNVDGASASVTNWIRAGDWFSVNGELKIAVLDADTDVTGNIVLTLSPRLRQAPPDNDPVETDNPTGVFMLAEASTQWLDRPGGFMDMALTFVEDIAS